MCALICEMGPVTRAPLELPDMSVGYAHMCASTATVACQEFRAADVCAYAAARISAAVPAIAMAGMLTVARLDALGEGVSIHQLTNPSLRPAPERSYCASALSRLCHRLPRAPAPAHRHCHARSPRFQNQAQQMWVAQCCRTAFCLWDRSL